MAYRRYRVRKNKSAHDGSRVPRIGPNRHTVPDAHSRCLPVLFGSGATPVLMYIASHPGCRREEICEGLGIKNDQRIRRMERLSHFRIVIGKRRFYINPALKHVRLLRVLLQRLSREFGLDAAPYVFSAKEMANVDSEQIDIPLELFLRPPRARVLLLLAAVGEAFHLEVGKALGLRPESVDYIMNALDKEGVVQRRRIATAKICSFSPAFCAHKELLTFLRAMASDHKEIIVAANALLLRREFLRTDEEGHVRCIAANVGRHAETIPGVSSKRAARVSRQPAKDF